MRQHKGFSLLEILIAFAIMAVALTIVLKIFGSGVNNAVISEDYSLAVQIAESLMARTGVETPLEIGETSGIENDKYAWLVTIDTITPNFVTVDPQTGNPPPPMFSVKVRVQWEGDDSSPRSVELSSLKNI